MSSARLRLFASGHDELPAFHAAYLLTIFLVAALFNVGAFAVLVLGHAVLDYVKYRDIEHMRRGTAIAATFRENTVDVLLVSVSVLFAVYLHHAAGLVTLGAAMRPAAFILRGIGMLLPEMGIMRHTLEIMSDLPGHFSRRKKVTKSRSRAQRLMFMCILMNVALLVLAPVILHLSAVTYSHILMDTLVPWRI